MTKTRRLHTDILWVTAGQVLSVAAMLVTMKVWAVYLEPAELGLMMLIIGAASILLGIIAGPLFQAMLVGYPSHLQNDNGRAFRTVSGGMVRKRVIQVIVLIIIIGTPMTWVLDIHWATALAVAGLFAVDSYRVFEQLLFAAARRQINNALTVSIDLVFRLIFVWFFLYTFQPSAYIAIAGNLLGAFLFVLVMRMTLRLEAFPGDKNVSNSLRNIIGQDITQIAKPLLPSMILANVTEMGNRYFIAAILGLQATGLFAISYGFVKRPYGMLNHVGEMVMTPVLKGAITEGQPAKIVRARFFWLLFIAVFSIIGAVLFYVLREPLVTFFLSEKYAGAKDMLFGLAVAVALFNVANVFNWFSLTLGDARAVLVNNIVGSVSTVLLTIVLGLTIGLSGVVWALIIGYGLQLLTSIVTFRVNLKRARLA